MQAEAKQTVAELLELLAGFSRYKISPNANRYQAVADSAVPRAHNGGRTAVASPPIRVGRQCS